ncbi:MAG: hypothetical protein JRJ87_01555 [Deltaproteobacteria bacterium]|nr:hypothetical protein [Deltaproteobacteria bacterium]
MRKFLCFTVAALAVVLMSTGSVLTFGCGASSPCDGVDCSEHGHCLPFGDLPLCVCDLGYHADKITCLKNDPCIKVTCSGHGYCGEQGDKLVCVCDQGYVVDGLNCVDPCEVDGVICVEPCEGVDCSGHGHCEEQNGEPVCICDKEYRAEGLECLMVYCEERCLEDDWCVECPEQIISVFVDIQGTSPQNVYLVSWFVDARVYRWNGSVWIRAALFEDEMISHVWSSGPDNVFFVGATFDFNNPESGDGIARRFDGESWTQVAYIENTGLADVWGSGPDNVYFVGGGGTVLRFDGESTAQVDIGTINDLRSIWGSASDDVWVGGSGGFLTHFNGTNWEPVESTTAWDIVSISGCASGDAYAVSNYLDVTDSKLVRESEILHYNGSRWQTVFGSSEGEKYYLMDVWCADAHNVYASGLVKWSDPWNSHSAGVVVHFDGESWARVLTDTSLHGYYAIWGTEPNNLYTVGSTVLHHRP